MGTTRKSIDLDELENVNGGMSVIDNVVGNVAEIVADKARDAIIDAAIDNLSPNETVTSLLENIKDRK